jgi:hypothetical protein
MDGMARALGPFPTAATWYELGTNMAALTQCSGLGFEMAEIFVKEIS